MRALLVQRVFLVGHAAEEDLVGEDVQHEVGLQGCNFVGLLLVDVGQVHVLDLDVLLDRLLLLLLAVRRASVAGRVQPHRLALRQPLESDRERRLLSVGPQGPVFDLVSPVQDEVRVVRHDDFPQPGVLLRLDLVERELMVPKLDVLCFQGPDLVCDFEVLVGLSPGLSLADFLQIGLADDDSLLDIKAPVVYDLVPVQLVEHLDMLFVFGLEYFGHQILDIFLVDRALLLDVLRDDLARIVDDLLQFLEARQDVFVFNQRRMRLVVVSGCGQVVQFFVAFIQLQVFAVLHDVAFHSRQDAFDNLLCFAVVGFPSVVYLLLLV